MLKEPADERPTGIRHAEWYQRHHAPRLPVSAEYLRKVAVEMDGQADALMRGFQPHQSGLLRASYALRAAADELDQLRSEK